METPLHELSDLRTSIYGRWERYEAHELGSLDTPARDLFFGATDALLDIEHALSGVANGLPEQASLAKLVAYGFLVVLVVQQDAAQILAQVVTPDAKWDPRADSSLNEIRKLRNRLAGHFALSKAGGRNVASIIDVSDRAMIAGTLYGLEGEPHVARFPRRAVSELVATNAAALLPVLREVDQVLSNPAPLFARLRSSAPP